MATKSTIVLSALILGLASAVSAQAQTFGIEESQASGYPSYQFSGTHEGYSALAQARPAVRAQAAAPVRREMRPVMGSDNTWLTIPGRHNY